MSIEPNWAALAPYLLVAGGLAMALGADGLKKLASAVVSRRQWSTAALKKAAQGVSSDQPPPENFREHVAVILTACPGAPYETRLAYLVDGLTEAQTLRREVERLGNTTLQEYKIADDVITEATP